MQALFESGRDLAGMLASRDGWKFGQWDAVSVDSGSEEAQMELLVFPALFSSKKCVRHGELGSGGTRFEPRQTGELKSYSDYLDGKLPGLLTSSIRLQTPKAIGVSKVQRGSFGRSRLPRCRSPSSGSRA